MRKTERFGQNWEFKCWKYNLWRSLMLQNQLSMIDFC